MRIVWEIQTEVADWLATPRTLNNMVIAVNGLQFKSVNTVKNGTKTTNECWQSFSHKHTVRSLMRDKIEITKYMVLTNWLLVFTRTLFVRFISFLFPHFTFALGFIYFLKNVVS